LFFDANNKYIEKFPQQGPALVYHLIFKKQQKISDTGTVHILG
jgi:hypothetical protein